MLTATHDSTIWNYTYDNTPSTGRFLTRDTWSGNANRPLSFNRWGYAYGNLVNLTDPTGMSPECAAVAASASFRRALADSVPWMVFASGFYLSGTKAGYVSSMSYNHSYLKEKFNENP
ncbi:MAG: hypothetical protein RBS68_12005 [Anaerolineales bacterium]|nr:hypothetical protein [Anaerolineales bacterium]